MDVGELLQLTPGTVVELDRRVGEPVDIFVNNRLIARGEVVLIDNALGVTLTENRSSTADAEFHPHDLGRRARRRFRHAAELARDAGAAVSMADTPADALDLLREGGGDMVMIDVDADIAGFMASLRAERFTHARARLRHPRPAERAVAAIRAGARDYVPLPPQRELIAAAIASVDRAQGHRSASASTPRSPAPLALATAVAPDQRAGARHRREGKRQGSRWRA